MTQMVMVAVGAETLKKIKGVQSEVEPYIVNMIKGSNESNCPYKVLREGDPDSKETKEAVTKVARMLYQHGLIEKLKFSLADDKVFDTILYAFGYWGGRTLEKYGDQICKCPVRCY